MYMKRHRNMLLYFNVIFGRVIQFFNKSKVTFMTPPPESLKILEILQYCGRVMSSWRRVNSTGQRIKFYLQYNSIFRQRVISTWRLSNSTRRRVKNAVTTMAYQRAEDFLVFIPSIYLNMPCSVLCRFQ